MFRVPFDRKEIAFELPSAWSGEEVRSRTVLSPIDLDSFARKAFREPVKSPPLEELAEPGDRVCIVFTDVTRACPDRVLIEPVLEILSRRGVRDEDVTLLCAVGTHRPSTRTEKAEKVGEKALGRYRVVDHDARDPENLVDLGKTEDGIPIVINRHVVEADLVISTGIVEPHQYAGYSGGRKTVGIGAAGEELVAATHGPAMIERPGTRLGRIEGNPFHEAVTEAARRAGLNFIVNVILDDDHRPVAVEAGDPEAAFAELVRRAREVFEVPIPKRYDVVVAGVGFPKDANLYQASRAPTYLFFAPTPVARPGGWYIVPAACGEGAGKGRAERLFFEILRNAPSAERIIREAREKGYGPGGQRAFMTAKVLVENEIIIVGARDPELVEAARFRAAASMDEAFRIVAENDPGPKEVLVVPQALLTLPVVEGG